MMQPNGWSMLPKSEPALNCWAALSRPIVGLAPMDGISDQPFRHIQKKYGNPDIVYTEFTSVEALCHGDWQALHNFYYDETQRPIIAQIYGKTPSYFYQVAILLCELGFDGIDLNMGCPAKNVAQAGCGAALIRTPDRAQSLIRAVQEGIRDWQNGATLADCPDLHRPFSAYVLAQHQQLPAAYQQRRPIPVSVKTRIGYETPVIDEWIPRLLAMQPAAITIHGRTLRQAYKGQADWDEIGRAAELAKGTGTLILGNGDVTGRADALARIAQYGVDGVLIGRASFGNPFVFQAEEPPAQRQTLIQIALEHARFYEQTYRHHQRYWFIPMRKHLGWYIKEIRGASHLRASLMQVNSATEAITLIRQQIERYGRGGLAFD
jgi:tRNA-dihydrouridine synthase B